MARTYICCSVDGVAFNRNNQDAWAHVPSILLIALSNLIVDRAELRENWKHAVGSVITPSGRERPLVLGPLRCGILF